MRQLNQGYLKLMQTLPLQYRQLHNRGTLSCKSCGVGGPSVHVKRSTAPDILQSMANLSSPLELNIPKYCTTMAIQRLKAIRGCFMETENSFNS